MATEKTCGTCKWRKPNVCCLNPPILEPFKILFEGETEVFSNWNRPEVHASTPCCSHYVEKEDI